MESSGILYNSGNLDPRSGDCKCQGLLLEEVNLAVDTVFAVAIFRGQQVSGHALSILGSQISQLGIYYAQFASALSCSAALKMVSNASWNANWY